MTEYIDKCIHYKDKKYIINHIDVEKPRTIITTNKILNAINKKYEAKDPLDVNNMKIVKYENDNTFKYYLGTIDEILLTDDLKTMGINIIPGCPDEIINKIIIDTENIDILRYIMEKCNNLFHKNIYEIIKHAFRNKYEDKLLFIFDIVNLKATSEYEPVLFSIDYALPNILSLFIKQGRIDNIYGIHTATTYASFMNKLYMVSFFNDKNINIDETTKYNRTSLSYASENGYLDIVEYVIKNGADINNFNTDNGYTPLIYAAENGHVQIVKYLILNKININICCKDNENALMKASRKGHVEIVKYLVDRGINISTVNNQGDDAFTIAMNNKMLPVIIYLNENGIIMDKHIMGAAANGYLNIVKKIIKKDINLKLKDKNGFTSLNIASKNGNLSVVEFLEDYIDIEEKDNEGNTPLNNAVIYAHFDIIKFLINRGADCKTRNKLGMTIFLNVSYRCTNEIYNYLYKYDEGEVNYKGNDLFENIIINDNTFIINKFRHLYYKSKYMEFAIYVGSAKMLKCMYEYTSYYAKCLHGIVKCNRMDIIDKLVYRSIIHKINKERDYNYRTLLHTAVINRHKKMIKYLVDEGIDKCALDYKDRVAFSYENKIYNAVEATCICNIM